MNVLALTPGVPNISLPCWLNQVLSWSSQQDKQGVKRNCGPGTGDSGATAGTQHYSFSLVRPYSKRGASTY